MAHSPMAHSLDDMARQALDELAGVLTRMTDADAAPLIEAIAGARRIATYGVGREGLMMRAFAMRLFHLGCDVHVVGDMTVPPLGPGDLLIVSAGPGAFSTVTALIGVAKKAGAKVACITAQPSGPAAQAADVVTYLPAQTMADDTGPAVQSILPMGSLYEGVQYVFFEVVVLKLRDRLAVPPEAMRANHTNLE